jgi:hypothetical protein
VRVEKLLSHNVAEDHFCIDAARKYDDGAARYRSYSGRANEIAAVQSGKSAGCPNDRGASISTCGLNLTRERLASNAEPLDPHKHHV